MIQSCRRLYVFEDGDDFDEDEFDDGDDDGEDEFDDFDDGFDDDEDAFDDDADEGFDDDDYTCKRAPSAIPVWLKTMLS